MLMLKLVLIWQVAFIGMPSQWAVASTSANATHCGCCIPRQTPQHVAPRQAMDQTNCCLTPSGNRELTRRCNTPSPAGDCDDCRDCNCGCFLGHGPTIVVLLNTQGTSGSVMWFTQITYEKIMTLSLEPASPPPRA